MTTSQHTVATPALTPHGGGRTAFGTLARIEALRFGRHPMFLFATAFGIAVTAGALSEQAELPTSDALGMPMVALTVGLGSVITAYHLTRSFHRSDELLKASPTSPTTRTASLCLTAGVSALVASGWPIVYYVLTPPALEAPDWMYGGFSHAEIATVVVGNTIIAAAGGTLLGVAAARWWRFRGAAVLLILALVVWTMGILGIFSNSDAPLTAWNRWIRLFAPVNYFNTAPQSEVAVDSLTGSPWWYFGWTLTLCALAAIAALLWRSEGPTRRRLIRIGAVTLLLSAVTYGLAASGGPDHVVRYYPDGHSIVLTH